MATFEEILKSFKSNQYAPIYVLYGEEHYLIDKIANYAIEHCIEPSEKDFCQKIIYGKDTSYDELAMLCSTQPMSFSGNPRQLILVKEAQSIPNKKTERIAAYLKNPNPFTIVVFCYKFQDNKSSYPKFFPPKAEFFKSEKLKEREMPKWIKDQLTIQKMRATSSAISTIVDYMGNNMEAIFNEIQKLKLTVGTDTEITESHVLKSMDIMKEFSMFDFIDHIAMKNHFKVAQIIEHYAKNPKRMELVPFVANLFNHYFTLYKIKIAQHNKKNENDISNILRIESWKLKKYFMQTPKTSILKLEDNLNTIFHYSRRLKGVNESGVSLPYAQFLKELTQTIMS